VNCNKFFERQYFEAMCGRFTITKSMEEIEERFNAEFEKIDEDSLFAPNYNASPSQKLPVITNTDSGRIVKYTWGLIPSWVKSPSSEYKMINARSETLLEKPSFKNAFRRRRCLVLADGYYEWQKSGKKKTPYYIKLKTGELFAFAGLWETWTDKNKNEIRSFTIITTEANELTKKIHDRMPCILEMKAEKNWLNMEISQQEAKEMLIRYPSEKLQMSKISLRVNSPQNNDPLLIEPVV
jgi:putative SOS response-associated peptidase YedK